MSSSAKQWVVLFDAVGTVLFAEPSVVDVYFEHGRRFGSGLSKETIRTQFANARRDVFGVNLQTARNLDWPSSESIETELWFRLVQQVFCDLQNVQPLFDSLWQHFARAENWRVFSDVERCLEVLNKQNVILGLASNFDHRLLDIKKCKTELRLAKHSFCSSEVGFRKPDPRFYQTVETELKRSYSDRPLNFAMIGDDFENDFRAPAAAGWTSWCLDRKGRHADAAGIIRSLKELELRER